MQRKKKAPDPAAVNSGIAGFVAGAVIKLRFTIVMSFICCWFLTKPHR
jgi:hypothetical protein